MKEKKIKNIKIDPQIHEVLKKYCVKKGYKLHKYIEKLILDNCKEQKDIYGDY